MAVQPVGPEIQSQEINDNFSDVENNIESHKAENVKDAHGFEVEMGTWTPTLAGTTVSGEHTYSVRDGVYTRLGDTCTATFIVRLSELDENISGGILIKGLPFAIQNTGSAASISRISNIEVPSGEGQLFLSPLPITPGQTELRLTSFRSDNTPVAMPTNRLRNNSDIHASITYVI